MKSMTAGRWALRRFLPSIGAWALAIWPVVGLAQLNVVPHADENIQHNSNVFDLPSGVPLLPGSRFGDTIFETRAGFDGVYLLGLQKFYLSGEFRRFDYDYFTALTHNENTLNAGLVWKASSLLDGTVDYLREERMVQFTELAASTALILETEKRATVSVNIAVTPDWRLETLARDRSLDSPRADVSGLSLHEDSIREGLRYVGVANLSAGLDLLYLKGSYDDDPTALDPHYSQYTGQLAATYIISGLTNFNGSIGYTRRSDPSLAGVSALTGAIGYQRSLTGKTTFNLQLTRAVNSYVTTGGDEIDTTASAAVTWQATYKAAVKAGYSWTNSKFPQSGLIGTNTSANATRVDHFELANLELDYQVLRWLMIRAYAQYQTRSSNQEIYAFNGSIVGVEFQVKPSGPSLGGPKP